MSDHARHQAGMTLVELLVALGLGAMLMLASSAVLLSASRSYMEQVESARLADNGRYAFDAIARALRQTAWVNWDASAAPLTHALHYRDQLRGLPGLRGTVEAVDIQDGTGHAITPEYR